MIRSPLRSPLNPVLSAVVNRRPTGISSPIIYPLDEAGALPQAAYGVVRLTSTYSGSAVRVVRQSDLAEQDIGFDGQSISLDEITAFIGTAVGKVKTLYDLTGNGLHATQSVLADMADIQVDMQTRGFVSLYLGPSSGYVLPAGISNDRRTFEIVEVSSLAATLNVAGFWDFGASSGGNVRAFQNVTIGQQFNCTPGGATGFWPQTAPRMVSHYSDAAGAVFEYDGETTSVAAFASSVAAGGYWGRLIVGGYPGNRHALCVAMYQRRLTTPQRDALRTSMRSILSQDSTGGVLMYSGDSIISASTAAALRNSIPHRTNALLATNPKVYQLGGGGNTFAIYLAGSPSPFTNHEGALCTKYAAENRVVFCLMGTNDLAVSGRTSSQVIADIQTYCGQVRSAGAKVIIATLLPRSFYGASTKAELDAVNASVRANWASYADGFVDYANNTTMGAVGAELNNALYLDGLHPTSHGYSFLAAQSAPEINRVFALP